MIKGAPVTPEASTISGASATTEVQNNSAEVQNNSASDSDPVDAEAPAKILIPLEHWVIKVFGGLYGGERWSSNIWFFQFLKDWNFGFLKL